ncbi:hypothetical protein [Komagataeibacter xylinus]|uniref:hypothetical protein n=1 Tax=Komagataeibacter xylinus TaxID=28448 RepID=UPI001031FE61|nr:hypothetical protein [Komagataeibacter xylinus]
MTGTDETGLGFGRHLRVELRMTAAWVPGAWSGPAGWLTHGRVIGRAVMDTGNLPHPAFLLHDTGKTQISPFIITRP